MHSQALKLSNPPLRIQHSRTWRVTGAVLLAHAAVAWLLVHNLTQTVSTGEPDNVIMASVVMDMPAPPAPTPQPITPKVQPKPRPQPTSRVAPQAHPSPVVAQVAPSDAAPIVPATPSSPPQHPRLQAANGRAPTPRCRCRCPRLTPTTSTTRPPPTHA